MQEKIKNIYISMLSNPHFSQFVKENENKTIEEIAMEYDIRLELIKCTEN